MQNRRIIGSVVVMLALAITLSARAGDAPPAATLGTLGSLVLPREGVAHHEGSWDRKGGNADARPVAPGQTITLMDYQGAGIIRRFWVTIAPRADMQIHSQAILRMYWDGEDVPSVECPIGAFFGVGFGEQKDYISLPLNETSGGYNCYWPMPFHKSARWTLENRSDKKIDAFYYNIDFTGYDKLPADNLRHFHAQWRRENPTHADQNYTILQTTGEGHFCGVALFMQAIKPRGISFLEGDEMIYFDGADKPSVNGTGTEDYFSSGWYFDRGTYSAPYHGVVIKDVPAGRISAYRWHIEDAMPFHKSIRVTIEHGTNNDHQADYSSVAYYYMTGKNPPNPPLPANAKDLLPTPPPAVKHIAGAIEGEALVPSAKASDGTLDVQAMDGFAGTWSGDAQLWWHPAKPGDVLTVMVPVSKSGQYDVIGHFCTAADYGTAAMRLGGAEKTVDFYHAGVRPSGPISLGRANLQAGENPMTITVTGKNEKSTGYLFGLDALELKPVK